MTRVEKLEAERARLTKLLREQHDAQRAIAHDRDESDTCEAGTTGCCIDHTRDSGSCEGW